MPGIVNKILVKVGDQIKAGDDIMIVIAMKMEVSGMGNFYRCWVIYKTLLNGWLFFLNSVARY